ncbi:MAG TPA: DNA polymerase III subunit alpha [Planctomycetota bacterium]|jgi:DNA polymerase-3 subunit alpha|nr:DNA polymerase III subunit alpha [Planctomycetota bacterium]
MSDPDFVHLHVHSEYSLLDGANRIPDLIASAQRDGQRAIALTDHGNLFGAIEHYQACVGAGIRPILGCEVYVAKRSRLEPHSKAKGNGYHHLTLLARNEQGWKNLMLLASTAYLDGLHFRPRIDRELLAKHAAGITCLSGCLASELSQLCIQGKDAEAEQLSATWMEIFGRDHFWLELQRNGIEIQTRVNESLARIHARTGIPLVATNDIHYLRSEDCHAHDVLLCINTGSKRAEEKRFRFDTDTLYFKTRAEMADMFRDVDGALRATMDVAEQVDLSIEFGRYRLPVFAPDSGETVEALFERLLEAGMARLYPGDQTAARQRLEYERRVIAELGFVSYFLIVWDLIRWARENGIPVGPGRGSAAGSIVAYLLGITKVDPLRYDLLFERFLNSARVSMPDIDIDFCKDGRGRVLEYTRKRYGQDRVAQIVTFNTMASRAVVRDVGRVLDLPLKEVDRITKKIPAGPAAPGLEEALEKDADLRSLKNERPDLAEVFKFSVQLEGLARNISTHAAGVVISDEPITSYVPLARNGDDIVTQWTMTQLEALGLLKMDYLGLRTLTILEKTLRNIVKEGGTPPDLDALPPGDPATYALLGAGDTLGVFQLESDGMRKLLARAKPDCFEDLIAILALYRPGPLESGMVDTFIRRKHGEEPISYAHPSLEPILRDTYGSLVYQEQVMLLANRLGDLSLVEADNLRKAMGKKKPEIMQKFAEQFIAGATKNGCKSAVAREIWDHMVKFGGYGFNKSHSTAYAVITYQTAYLKANHRCAFLAANMSCEMGDSDKVRDFLDDARRAKVAIHPPDIARSRWEFEPEDGGIRFGFGAIKGTGERAIEALCAARARLLECGTPPGLHELASEVDAAEVGRLNWEALAKAGAFDSSAKDRGAVLAALDGALADGARRAADRRASQGDLFGAATGPAVVTAGPAGSTLSRSDLLRAEFEVLGFYLTGHPLEERSGLLGLLSSARIDGLAAIPGGTEVIVAGLVLGKSEALVKTGKLAGKRMARFRLEDLSGHVPVTCFPRTWEECGKKIEDGAVLVCRARLEDRAEEPALLLEEALTLDEALARFAGCVVVKIGSDDAHLLPGLRAVIERHRGKSPLYLQVTGDDGGNRKIRAGSDLSIEISERFAREVDAVLGAGRVRVARM